MDDVIPFDQVEDDVSGSPSSGATPGIIPFDAVEDDTPQAAPSRSPYQRLEDLSVGVVRGGANLAALGGDVVSYPIRKGIEYATGRELPTVSSEMEKALGQLTLGKNDTPEQAIGEFLLPVGPAGKGLQVLSGLGAGTANYASKQLAPDSPWLQVFATILGGASPLGLKAAGSSLWKALSPAAGAAKSANEIASSLRSVVPDALTEGATAADRTKSIASSLEAIGTKEAEDAGKLFDALPADPVNLDNAIAKIKALHQEVSGIAPAPGSSTHSVINYLESLKPKDQIIERAASTLVDEAGNPLIAASREVIPGGPAMAPLNKVQNVLRDVGRMGMGSKGVDRHVLGEAKEAILDAAKASVRPEAMDALVEARNAWKYMDDTYQSGGVGAVRKSLTDVEGNLNTLKRELLNDSKSAEQLVKVMTPKDLANSQSLVLSDLLIKDPEQWAKTITSKYDSYRAIFGKEKANQLLNMVQKDGSIGKKLLQDESQTKAVLAKLGIRAVGGGLIGYEADGYRGAALGVFAGLASNKGHAASVTRSRAILMQAAAGVPEALKILNSPATKTGYAEGIKILTSTLQAASQADESKKKVTEPSMTNPAEDEKLKPLVDAVIGQESNGKPGATSEKGAQGLMQLMPSTGRELFNKSDIKGEYDPYNPEQNRILGTMYLKELLAKYKGDPELALTAYHSGPGRVDQLLRKTGGSSLSDIIDELGPVGKRYAKEVLNRLNLREV